ncbi:uncharacterized protein LOC108673691 [Hyalella azteca]|uniref:Uncharacterized protein LOC108673691 n=1 Tax=Hyalella azteca TaxID=294128 RepID=A0A8B7NTK8_HYAAZ|nr:uncharacterized protein LOC108673691 [Hyalella azteca]
MWLKVLTLACVVNTLLPSMAVNSSLVDNLWKIVPGDVSSAPATDKLQFTSPSLVVCAAQATAAQSSFFCHDKVTCVIITKSILTGYLGVPSASLEWKCYLTGPWCRPPFMQVRDLGCLQFDINNLMNFSAARTSCPPPATLWYPKSDQQAATIADYLTNQRYPAPAGGVCGSSVPLPDGYPGPCRPTGTATCCNATGVCGGTTADCTCPTCINYRTVAKAFWTGFQRKAGVWTYDDNRTVMDTLGVAPWGPIDPKNTYDCAAIFFAPAYNTYYQYSDVNCTASSYASICLWPELA